MKYLIFFLFMYSISQYTSVAQTLPQDLKECLDFVLNFYDNDKETMMRVYFFLNKEANEWSGDTPVRSALHRLINSEDTGMVKEFMKNIADDTRRARENEEFLNIMRDLYAGFEDAAGHIPLSESWIEKVTSNSAERIKTHLQDPVTAVAFTRNIVQSLAHIPQNVWPEVAKCFERNFFTKGLVSTVFRESTSLATKFGTDVATVSLVGVQLSMEAIKSIYDWYQGRITGKRCAKQIADSIVSVAGGAGGAYMGAYIGASTGPVGAVVGAVIGGVLGSNVGDTIANHLTCTIFDLPKSVAEENAYKFFGVSRTTENAKINSAYRRLALQHHPDKGGKREQWLELQTNLQIIKTARGG